VSKIRGLTGFHEHFHNIGIEHSKDPEYAYACEECCSDEKLDENNKKISCKICSGDYPDKNDPTYLDDMIQFSMVSRNNYKVLNSIVLRSILDLANDGSSAESSSVGLSKLAYFLSQRPYNPIGPFLALKIKEKKIQTSDAFFETYLDYSTTKKSNSNASRSDIDSYNQNEQLKSAAPTLVDATKALTDSIVALYVEKNISNSINILKNNKESIRTLLNSNTNVKQVITVKAEIKEYILIQLSELKRRNISDDKNVAQEILDLKNELGV